MQKKQLDHSNSVQRNRRLPVGPRHIHLPNSVLLFHSMVNVSINIQCKNLIVAVLGAFREYILDLYKNKNKMFILTPKQLH